MKKIFMILLCVMLVLAMILTVGAQTEEETTPLPEVPDSAVGETEGESSDISEQIDYSALAKQFVSYIQSGEAPDELIDSMIAMGEEMQGMKEQGYTFQERLLQLVTPENIIVTAAALFLLIGGVLMFIMRRRLNNSGYDIEDILTELQKQKAEKEAEKEGRERAEQRLLALDSKFEKATSLLEQIYTATQSAGRGSVAVAKMVKDVFLSSRTIDADGKALVTHNFIEATNELNGGNDEQQGKE